jgi:hypothetical protein
MQCCGRYQDSYRERTLLHHTISIEAASQQSTVGVSELQLLSSVY